MCGYYIYNNQQEKSLFMSNTEVVQTIEILQTSGAPAPPPPPPPSGATTEVSSECHGTHASSQGSPDSKGHSLTGDGLFATLATCKHSRMHVFKKLFDSFLTVDLPRSGKDEKQKKEKEIPSYQQPVITWSWHDGNHTMELVPCWTYHFFSNGRIQLMQRCKYSQQNEMTLEEEILGLETATPMGIVQLAKEHYEPIPKWAGWIAKRLGGINLQDLNKVCQILSKEERTDFFIACMASDLIQQRSRQVQFSALVTLVENLSPISVTVEPFLTKLCQAPYSLKFQ